MLPSVRPDEIVDREDYLALLGGAIASIEQRKGAITVIDGISGVGKSRLLLWAKTRAETAGFDSFQLSFPPPPSPTGRLLRELTWWLNTSENQSATSPSSNSALPPLSELTIIPEEEPSYFFDFVNRVAAQQNLPVMLISSRSKAMLEQFYPGLPSKTTFLELSAQPGPNRVNPGNLKAEPGSPLAAISQFLSKCAGSVVAFHGLERAKAVGSFESNIADFVSELRTVAEEKRGHVILSIPPNLFDDKLVAQMYGEGKLVWPPPPERPIATLRDIVEAEGSVLDRLRKHSNSRPVVLVLDDLQWMDPASWGSFLLIGRNINLSAVGVIGSFTKGDETRQSESVQSSEIVFRQLERDGLLIRSELTGLPGEQVPAYCSAALHAPVEISEDAGKLLAMAEGNPYLIQLMLLDLQDAGHIKQKGSRKVIEFPQANNLARDLRWADRLQRHLRERLRPLTPDERRVLEYAAPIGREFEEVPLSEALDQRPAEVDSLLRALEDRTGVVFHVPGSPTNWKFEHTLTWKGILDDPSNSNSSVAAGKLAAWWQANRPSEPETIAHLYVLARKPSESLPWLTTAIAGAVRDYQSSIVGKLFVELSAAWTAANIGKDQRIRVGQEIAESLYQSTGASRELERILRTIIREAPSREILFELEAVLALVQSEHSRDDAVALIKSHEASESVASTLPPKTRALLALETCIVLLREGQYTEVQEAASRALLEGEKIPPWIQCLAYSVRSWARYQISDVKGSGDDVVAGEAIARNSELLRFQASFTHTKGWISRCQGQLDAAEVSFSVAANLYLTCGDVPNMIQSNAHLAEIIAMRGRFDQALSLFAQELDRAKTYGLNFHMATVLFSRAQAYFNGCKWREAARDFAESTQLILPSSPHLQRTVTLLSSASAILGDQAASDVKGSEQSLQASDSDSVSDRMLSLRLLAAVQAQRNDLVGASLLLTQALELRTKAVDTPTVARILVQLARVKELQGDPQSARTLREEALREVGGQFDLTPFPR